MVTDLQFIIYWLDNVMYAVLGLLLLPCGALFLFGFVFVNLFADLHVAVLYLCVPLLCMCACVRVCACACVCACDFCPCFSTGRQFLQHLQHHDHVSPQMCLPNAVVIAEQLRK